MKLENKNRSSLIHQKLKIQGIEAIKKNIIYILIIFSVLGASAPFTHILFPKKAQEKIELEKAYDSGNISKDYYLMKRKELKKRYKFAGFTNVRRFMYAFGLPVALFFCSLTLLYSSKYITDSKIKKGILFSYYCFHFTALYFMSWTLWAYKKGSDLPIELYYLSLIFISVLISISNYYLINGRISIRERLLQNIRLLTRFIVTNKPDQGKEEYINSYVETFKKLKKG